MDTGRVAGGLLLGVAGGNWEIHPATNQYSSGVLHGVKGRI